MGSGGSTLSAEQSVSLTKKMKENYEKYTSMGFTDDQMRFAMTKDYHKIISELKMFDRIDSNRRKSSGALLEAKLIEFSAFKAKGQFPRCPDDLDITTSFPSADVRNSFVVYISHCWLRSKEDSPGFSGRPHPDNATNDSYRLCVEGIQRIWMALAPDAPKVYIWLDFSCLNQDSNPIRDINCLDKIIQQADCVFTPILDRDDEGIAPAFDNMFADYRVKSWNSGTSAFVNRAWCRLEMFYSSNIPPTAVSKRKAERCFKGSLQTALTKQGRRPHFLFSSTGMASTGTYTLKQPILLPKLHNFYFAQYHPSKGYCSNESDKAVLANLVKDLDVYIRLNSDSYDGSRNEQGQRHGGGRMFFLNGDTYEGSWLNDAMTGKGVFRCADGGVFEGDFKDGKLCGIGKFTTQDGLTVFEGIWKDSMLHGEGRQKCSNGDVYEGAFLQGSRHGQGTLTVAATGEVYTGSFSQGERTGTGTCVYSNGAKYIGEWLQGRKHGRGILTAGDGSVYEGCFVADKREGSGKMTYPDGISYEGSWKGGMTHGAGKETYPDGGVHTGFWVNNVKHGSGRYESSGPDGDFWEGNWELGQLSGKARRRSKGILYEGSFKEGQLHGSAKETMPDGTVSESTWFEGTRDMQQPTVE